MTESEGSNQFLNEVFKTELEEITARRKNLKDDSADQLKTKTPDVGNGLVGLACSGGGIRSASFSLGVIQQLISLGLFKKIDYLSTVSGGGYIGSCISTLMMAAPEQEKLLTERSQLGEPRALNHLRNHSNYLRIDGFFSSLRIPLLFMEGVFRSILSFLPAVIIAVFLTELFFEVTGRELNEARPYIPFLGMLPLLFATFLRPILKDKRNWTRRDKADGRFTVYFVVAAVSVISVPLLAMLETVVDQDAVGLFEDMSDFAGNHLWLSSVTLILISLVIIGGFVLVRRAFLLFIAGIIAPLFLILLYIVLCVETINSPIARCDESNYATSDVCKIIDGAVGFTPDPENPDTFLMPIEIDSVLERKHITASNYRVKSHTNDWIELARVKDDIDFFTKTFTTNAKSKLNIKIIREVNPTRKMLEIQELRLLKGNAEWWLYGMGLLVLIYNLLFVNINRFSLHPFYRDRLSKTFLITPTGARLEPADNVRLSQLNQTHSIAPYHIINITLNLQGSRNDQLRSRKSAPFIMSKRYCGSDHTGYCATAELEKKDKYFNLGTAMAISAAAAAPNMGAATVKHLTFLMTLLNIRLSYWLPHPQRIRRRNWKHYKLLNPLGLSYLLREALGKTNDNLPFINCSDGGHIENLAVYELLRRRCRTIICIDGEADPNYSFHGLITLQRYAEIDFGAKINIDLSKIKPGTGQTSEESYSVGNIVYSNDEVGRFIYIKLSYCGDEPEYLHYYKAKNSAFPHQSTSDQFFDETQFEVYRALGNHIAGKMMKTFKEEINSSL